MERYITGTGQIVRVHDRNPDCDKGCPIHNPTDPHAHWPTHWRGDRGLMERICPHGIGHPDDDHLNWVERTFGLERALEEAVHGCDGCCKRPVTLDEKVAAELTKTGRYFDG